jgi:hypothetical protein
MFDQLLNFFNAKHMMKLTYNQLFDMLDKMKTKAENGTMCNKVFRAIEVEWSMSQSGSPGNNHSETTCEIVCTLAKIINIGPSIRSLLDIYQYLTFTDARTHK